VKATDIVSWAESRYGFYVDRRWRLGRWALERGPIVLADYHRRLLRHVFTPDADGRLPYDVVAWCEPAKSGKSAIAGLCAEYAGLHLDGDVVMASNKQNQAASLMYKSLTDSIEYNPHLPNVEPGRYEVAFSNGNAVRAIPSNYRGEAGARFSLFLLDEPWGIVYRDGVRLWSEFKNDPTRIHSLKLAIGYAGFLESELWLNLLQSGLAGEPVSELLDIDDGRGGPACWRNGRAFVFWSHRARQPWQTQEWIESQRQSLSAAQFQRMIHCDFVESEGDFIEAWAWEALVDPDHEPLPPCKDVPVAIGLDLALAPGGDDCALIGVFSEDEKVKVAFHKVWKGRDRRRPLRLTETVVPYIKRLARDYRVSGVWFDPWQAVYLTDVLRQECRLRCYKVPQTTATRGDKDTTLYNMALEGKLVLYDHPDLRNMASFASAKELGDGRVFIKKAGRGKIDLLIALSNVADECKRQDVGQLFRVLDVPGW
jgi:hypothetical protein